MNVILTLIEKKGIFLKLNERHSFLT